MPTTKKEAKTTTVEEPTSEALGAEGFYLVNHRTVSFEEDLEDA